MASFVSELRQRNVLRVAAAYALVAWIIIEAGSVLLPTFGADEGIFQAYVIIVIAGFVVALVAAWVFEITPEGVKLDKDVDRSLPGDVRAKQTFNYAIIGLLIVALAVSITFNVTGVRGGIGPTDDGPQLMRRSIAVLPFTSLSTDPDNVLFVDGIHDDLLTKLASIGAMKVISRTSVLEYRNTTKNLRQIGEELGVETLLEGTVQRVGDNVRINVQLIDAVTDEHLWAQTYDRQLTMQNIFAIQSEISAAIAGALQATLMPRTSDSVASIPTQDIRAYSLYVSGRDNMYLRRLEPLKQARRQFEQALELDPEYAAAYAALAENLLLLFINHNALDRDTAYALAQDNLDEAFRLNPELADAHATLGLLKMHQWSLNRLGDENLEAEAAFEYAIYLNPNHAQAYMWFANLRQNELRADDAIGLYHRSMQLDPLARVPYLNLPTLYAQQGQNDVALKLWLDAIEIHPEWPNPYQMIAFHLAGLGRLDEAYAWQRKAVELGGDQPVDTNIGVPIFARFGATEKARELLVNTPAIPAQKRLIPVFDLLLELDFDGALVLLAEFIDSLESLPPFLTNQSVELAILVGDLDKAREYLFLGAPILASDADLPIDRFTVRQVVNLAYIHLQSGDLRKGNKILTAALPVVQSLPRLGLYGQGIRDVQILALLGRKEEALQALREAVDAGFRSSILSSSWFVEIDPFLESIRDDSRFQAISRELDSHNAKMYQRLLETEKSGDWESLMALASTS